MPLSVQEKQSGRRKRRNSKQTLLLSPDQEEGMSEDGGSKSRSESMLDVARGLSASLQNIRRYDHDANVINHCDINVGGGRQQPQ